MFLYVYEWLFFRKSESIFSSHQTQLILWCRIKASFENLCFGVWFFKELIAGLYLSHSHGTKSQTETRSLAMPLWKIKTLVSQKLLNLKLNLNRSLLHVKPGKASGTLRGTEGFTHALWSPRLSTAISCSNGGRFLWSAHFTVQAYLKWLSSASKFWSLLPHQGWNAAKRGRFFTTGAVSKSVRWYWSEKRKGPS